MHQTSSFSQRYQQLIARITLWLTPSRLKIYPRMIGAMMLLVWAVSQALVPGPIDSAKTIIGFDFAAFYTAGSFLKDGRFAALYNPYAQLGFQHGLVAPAETNKFMYFVSPPFTVPLYLPFVQFGYTVGLYLWWGAGIFAILLSLYLLKRELLPEHDSSPGAMLLMSFTFYPTLMWFFSAQSTALMLLAYVAFFVLLRRGRDFWAGVVLGLLVYKPTLAIGLGLVLLFKFRWRAWLGGLVSASAWIGSGFLFFPDLMQEYIRQSPILLRAAMGDIWVGQSLNEFSILLLENVWKSGSFALSLILILIGIAVLFLWWRKVSWQPASRSWEMAWAATIALGLLISPHFYSYDAMLLILPFAIVWQFYPRGTKGRILDRGPILAWSAALYVVEFLYIYLTRLQYELMGWLGMPQVALQLGTLAIAGWAWVVYRAGQDEIVTL